MANEISAPASKSDEEVRDQQFLRAVRSFEAIIVSQIDVKKKLSDRLNYSIRAGIIILGLIAVSILILLLTLSSQINRMSDIVSAMNHNFTSVSAQMKKIETHVSSMEQRVATLDAVNNQTKVMDRVMAGIATDMEVMRGSLGEIRGRVSMVRNNVANISVAIDKMNIEVQRMGYDMHHMGKPARTLNRMFPFP